MPLQRIDIPDVPASVAEGVLHLRRELELPEEFPPAALEQADEAADQPAPIEGRVDRTDIEFVAIDPPESMDLDQIVHIQREGDGYLVQYGIADVAAFVPAGSPIDEEAHRRGQTFYAPGARIPLHPTQLSEGAASLLNDGRPRPAYLWHLHLDAAGEIVEVQLEKAVVLNREKLNYAGVQAALDEGTEHETLLLLREVGELRQQVEIERGGVSLNLPEQEVVPVGQTWELEFRDLLPVENWNAQVSLLTGIAAASVMLQAKVGIVRTLPEAEDWAIARLRRQVRTLGVDWPRDMSYPEFVRSLDPHDPQELAALVKCTTLFRGASYVAFDGEIPDQNLNHGALATPYAHVTAPLRRLVDRYGLEVCWCVLNGQPIPEWVRAALPDLPSTMNSSNQLAARYANGIVSLAEALVMSGHEGQEFEAVLIDVHPKSKRGTYQLTEQAVEIHIEDADENKVGEAFTLRLDEVDLVEGRVSMSVVSRHETSSTDAS